MIRVEIDYNPYKMKTSMKINGIDVQDEKRAVDYSKFRKLITQGTPLQTWIEPIEYMGWKGFVNELIEEDQNDDVTIVFSGREIDFKDLHRLQGSSLSTRANWMTRSWQTTLMQL